MSYSLQCHCVCHGALQVSFTIQVVASELQAVLSLRGIRIIRAIARSLRVVRLMLKVHNRGIGSGEKRIAKLAFPAGSLVTMLSRLRNSPNVGEVEREEVRMAAFPLVWLLLSSQCCVAFRLMEC